MTTPSASRRRFIRATGVALSVPLAGLGAAVANAMPMEAGPDDSAAIHALMRAHARSVEASDDFGANERITIAPDGRTATAALRCTVRMETAIGPDCPLVDMARQQGGGVVTRSEQGALEYEFTKRDGVWTLERAAFRPDS